MYHRHFLPSLLTCLGATIAAGSLGTDNPGVVPKGIERVDPGWQEWTGENEVAENECEDDEDSCPD